MERTKRPAQKPGETYVGALVDDQLWKEVKWLSIQKKKTIAVILKEALQLYLKSDDVVGVRKQ